MIKQKKIFFAYLKRVDALVSYSIEILRDLEDVV